MSITIGRTPSHVNSVANGTVITTVLGAPAANCKFCRGQTTTGGSAKLPAYTPESPNVLPCPMAISMSIRVALDDCDSPAKYAISVRRTGPGNPFAPVKDHDAYHCW